MPHAGAAQIASHIDVRFVVLERGSGQIIEIEMSSIIAAVEPDTRPRIPGFVPGLELNRRFYQDVVQPLLDRHFPGLVHSAALLGEGSDVLGFDTERSTDHNWGPRGVLFFSQKDFKKYAHRVSKMFRKQLPTTFHGFPTNYTKPRETYLVQQMRPIERGPVNHLIRTFTVRSFFRYYLGFDPVNRIKIADWLTFPQQALLEVTAGAVYWDGLGTLRRTQDRFAYFPRDVWIYMLHSQWLRIANELSYQARCGEAGDEIGSRVLASRMVDEIVRLCFLMERRYMPYSKWRGTGFMTLPCAEIQAPLLARVLGSGSWRERQRWLAESYRHLGMQHNALGITKPVSTELVDFHGRGYPVIDIGPYLRALDGAIENKKLRKMKYRIGSVDQFINHARVNHENYLHRELTCLIR